MPADEAIRAAAKVLRLAGYAVFATPRGFVAAFPPDAHERPGARSPMPRAFWAVTGTRHGDRVTIDADLRTHYGGEPYGRDASAYPILFDRMDYLLKRRATWLTCAQAAATWTGRDSEGTWSGRDDRSNAAVLCTEWSEDDPSTPFLERLRGRNRKLAEPDPDAPLPPGEPGDAQWSAMTTRFHPGVPASRLLAAARRALERSHSQVVFRDLDDGFVAALGETWIAYVVLGGAWSERTHYWEVRARDEAGGSLASVYVTTEESGDGFTILGGRSIDRRPGWPHQPLFGMGAYGLFWDRVASELTDSPTWPSCPKGGFGPSTARLLANPEYADFRDPLCFSRGVVTLESAGDQ